MRTVDYVFGWLLVVASLMHGAGSMVAYRNKPELLLWAEAATLAGLLLGAINLLRAGRPGDRVLALVSCAGCAGWILVAFGFGRLVGTLLDPRAVSHEVITLVLLVFSFRSSVSVESTGHGARSARMVWGRLYYHQRAPFWKECTSKRLIPSGTLGGGCKLKMGESVVSE